MIPGVYKGAPLKIPADDWRIVQQMVAEYRTRGAIGSNGGFRFAPPKTSTPPILPPWWPTERVIAGDPEAEPPEDPVFKVRVEPSTINNLIPRLTWADADTVIGHPGGTGDLEVEPFETGIFYAACAFTAGVINEVTLHKTTEPDPPADTSSVFHIVTHFYIADETTIYARPMYRSGIKAIQCGDPEAEPPVIDWRW